MYCKYRLYMCSCCVYSMYKVYLTHHITHKSTTSRRDVTWRCLRGINLPGWSGWGWSLQTRLHPHPDLSHPNWMEEIEKQKLV